MSRVKNQNIVQFVESGLAKTLDVYWIVMEMLQGSTLSNILTKNGPFSEVDVIKVALHNSSLIRHTADIPSELNRIFCKNI
jgi:hypothetical protein